MTQMQICVCSLFKSVKMLHACQCLATHFTAQSKYEEADQVVAFVWHRCQQQQQRVLLLSLATENRS